MQLRLPASHPPTADEMRELHECYREIAHQEEEPSTTRTKPKAPRVRDFTFRSSHVIYPEQRNVHGKLFGGYTMEQAQNLAQYAAAFLAQGNPIFPLGIDEAIFMQPIAIGDLITFCARIVHSTAHTCRVLVTVEVRDPADRDRVPKRSNRLMFLFASDHFPSHPVVPETYSEILMHIDAKRRYAVEGPTDNEVAHILNEARALE